MGVRGARRDRWPALPLGRRAQSRWQASDERLAGQVSGQEHRCRRSSWHCPGGCLLAERLRLVQHDRQCLGMVPGLVRSRDLCRLATREPDRTLDRISTRDARRFLPVPQVVLQSLSCRFPQFEHAGQLDRQLRLPLRQGRLSPPSLHRRGRSEIHGGLLYQIAGPGSRETGFTNGNGRSARNGHVRRRADTARRSR